MEGNSPKNAKEHLVAEQKGLFYSFLGISIAALFAIIFRGVFSDAKVKFRIEELLKNSDLYGSYSLEGASLSLSNRGLPNLALVLRGGELLARGPKCQPSPLIQFDEARIPLSFFELLKPGYRVESLLLQEAHLSFIKDTSNECTEMAAGTQPTLKIPGEVKSPNPERRPLPLSKVVIHRLVASFPDWPQLQFEFDDLVYEKDRIEELAGKLRVQDLRSDLAPALIAYFEIQKEKSISGWVKGHWREGKYDFQIKGKNQEKLQVQGELSYLPLQSLVHLSGDKESSFERMRTWLSTKVNAHIFTDDLFQSSIHLTEVKVEGDLAETSADDIQIRFDSLGAWQVEPFIINVESLRPGQLIKQQGEKKLPPIFSSLGQLKGEIQVTAKDQLSFKGAWLRPEFVFSSRGQRVSQLIDAHSLDAQFDQGNISLKMSELSVEGGGVEGEISYSGNEREGKIQLDLEELNLSQEVEALLTSGGEISALNIKGEFDIQGVDLRSAKAQIGFDQLLIDAMHFENNSVHVQGGGEILSYQLKSQKMECQADCRIFGFLQEALPKNAVSETKVIRGEDLKANVEVGSKFMKWGNAQVNFLDHWTLISKGLRQEELNGDIELYHQKKLIKSWQLRTEASKVVLEAQ